MAWWRIGTALCMTVMLAGCTSEAPTPPAPLDPVSDWDPVEPQLATQFQTALENARAEQDLPGLAMAIAYRDTRQMWISSTGYSDLAAQTPWQPTHESRIGSVTKTFTTTIILQLVEEGVLSLDDPIEMWVPGWWTGLTLRHLLEHTSGIVGYDDVNSFDKSASWTPQELVEWAYAAAPSPTFPPGSQWSYSNTNFALLGLTIEAATGQSYRDVLNERLIEPLELGDSRLALSGDSSPNLVRCYSGSPPVDSSTKQDPSYGWAAGALVSTPENVARWIIALYGEDVLAPDTLAMMTTPNGATAPDEEDYGLGTVIENGSDNNSEHTLVGHTGGLSGYQTSAYYLQESNVALIVMTNWEQVDLRAASAHGWAAILGIPYP